MNWLCNAVSNCAPTRVNTLMLHGKFIFMCDFVDRIKYLNGQVLSRFDKMGQLTHFLGILFP